MPFASSFCVGGIERFAIGLLSGELCCFCLLLSLTPELLYFPEKSLHVRADFFDWFVRIWVAHMIQLAIVFCDSWGCRCAILNYTYAKSSLGRNLDKVLASCPSQIYEVERKYWLFIEVFCNWMTNR